jgi:hypothetical protein
MVLIFNNDIKRGPQIKLGPCFNLVIYQKSLLILLKYKVLGEIKTVQFLLGIRNLSSLESV